MLRTILVPVDGSALAWRAVPYATRLARAARARLILLHATSPGGPEQPSPFELTAMADGLRQSGISVEAVVYRVYHDDMARAICDAARERAADLIVMSTHGRGGLGRWLYGSVADAVLRQAEVPVLLVSATCDHSWPTNRPPRLLVPLDGSEIAVGALKPAAELAGSLRAELLLLRVIDSAAYPYLWSDASTWKDPEPDTAEARQQLEQLAEPLRAIGRTVEVLTVFGSPTAVIASVADERGVDLIAMATHGRGGLARLVLGSVATATLQRASVPLLAVRPVAVRQAAERAEALVAAT